MLNVDATLFPGIRVSFASGSLIRVFFEVIWYTLTLLGMAYFVPLLGMGGGQKRPPPANFSKNNAIGLKF